MPPGDRDQHAIVVTRKAPAVSIYRTDPRPPIEAGASQPVARGDRDPITPLRAREGCFDNATMT